MAKTQVRDNQYIYCDRCDMPIENEAERVQKNTFNYHKVCPTPKDILKSAAAYRQGSLNQIEAFESLDHVGTLERLNQVVLYLDRTKATLQAKAEKDSV